jgi:hypothetical protein
LVKIPVSPTAALVLLCLAAPLAGLTALATQAPSRAMTETSLTLGPGPEAPDPDAARWMLTATVVAAAGVSGTPLGLVEFFDDRVSLGTAALTLTDDGIVARLRLDDASDTLHLFSAVYQGDARFEPSASDFLVHPGLR